MQAGVAAAHRLSSCALQVPEHGLSGGISCLLFHGTWNLPRPGIKPMCLALAAGFLSIAPLGKFTYTSFSHL